MSKQSLKPNISGLPSVLLNCEIKCENEYEYVMFRPLIFSVLFFFVFFLKAIQNPNDEALQEQAWAAVVPLVGKLKKFYEFSQRLGIHLLYLCLYEP